MSLKQVFSKVQTISFLYQSSFSSGPIRSSSSSYGYSSSVIISVPFFFFFPFLTSGLTFSLFTFQFSLRRRVVICLRSFSILVLFSISSNSSFALSTWLLSIFILLLAFSYRPPHSTKDCLNLSNSSNLMAAPLIYSSQYLNISCNLSFMQRNSRNQLLPSSLILRSFLPIFLQHKNNSKLQEQVIQLSHLPHMLKNQGSRVVLISCSLIIDLYNINNRMGKKTKNPKLMKPTQGDSSSMISAFNKYANRIIDAKRKKIERVGDTKQRLMQSKKSNKMLKVSKRASKFALLEENEQAPHGLTHKGKKINELEEFNDVNFDSDVEDQEFQNMHENLNFTGFDEEEKPKANDRPKTKTEVYKEIMEKSKLHRHLKQEIYEENLQKATELDQQFPELASRLQFRTRDSNVKERLKNQDHDFQKLANALKDDEKVVSNKVIEKNQKYTDKVRQKKTQQLNELLKDSSDQEGDIRNWVKNVNHKDEEYSEEGEEEDEDEIDEVQLSSGDEGEEQDQEDDDEAEIIVGDGEEQSEEDEQSEEEQEEEEQEPSPVPVTPKNKSIAKSKKTKEVAIKPEVARRLFSSQKKKKK